MLFLLTALEGNDPGRGVEDDNIVIDEEITDDDGEITDDDGEQKLN